MSRQNVTVIVLRDTWLGRLWFALGVHGLSSLAVSVLRFAALPIFDESFDGLCGDSDVFADLLVGVAGVVELGGEFAAALSGGGQQLGVFDGGIMRGL